MHFNKYIKSILKNISRNSRVAINQIVSAITEASRTISYVETVSNKADTLHRHIKNSDEGKLKKAFELNTRKAIKRMGYGKTILAIDVTHELYYGKNGRLNVRQKKYENGTCEAFDYVVLSIVKPRPLPLMALPYRQGDDITKLVIELLDYAKTLSIQIQYILFDRGFYIGALIDYLSSEKIKYLIFVPQNSAMKRYISQTENIASFDHEMKWNKKFSWWKTETRIVIIKSQFYNQKKKEWQDCYWCFATNLKQNL